VLLLNECCCSCCCCCCCLFRYRLSSESFGYTFVFYYLTSIRGLSIRTEADISTPSPTWNRTLDDVIICVYQITCSLPERKTGILRNTVHCTTVTYVQILEACANGVVDVTVPNECFVLLPVDVFITCKITMTT
jgi:hypothetical protein